MNDNLYSGLNVAVRAHETSLLQPEHYERMLNANSFEEAINVLRETPYRNSVDTIKENHDYDAVLSKELEKTYKLVEVDSQDPLIIEFAGLRYAYHNMKVLFKEEYTDNDLSHLYVTIGRYTVPQLRMAVRTGLSDTLGDDYLQVINHVRNNYEAYENLYAVDIILDNAYFEHYLKIAEEINDFDLIAYVKRFADYSNISFLVRAMKQERTPNFLESVLTDVGDLDKESLVELGRDNLANVTRDLSDGLYQNIVEEATNKSTGEIDPVKFDQLKDNELMEEMKNAKIKSFGPFPSIAFLHAKEIEAMNIRLLLAGQENNIERDQVKERMRLNYV